MINLFKKAGNILPSQEKVWFTLGWTIVCGIYVYMAFDYRLKKKKYSSYLAIKKKKEEDLNENSDYDKSPLIGYSPIKLSKFSSASSKKVFKIVITGGPCSGKTTALNTIAEVFKNRGFRVYIAAEAAGILHAGGANMNIEEYPEIKQIKFQGNLLSLQMAIEDRITEVAMVECTNLRPGVILCDRGTMDGAAFISKEKFEAILNKKNENLMNIRDNRYDGVIHLVTAANGAHEFFKSSVSEEQAMEMDNQLQEAWKAHPQFFKINNFQNETFEGKMERTVESALKMVGMPSSISFYKKYLLKSFDSEKGIFDLLPNDLLLEQTQIEDTFLQSSSDLVRKIRKRGTSECSSYMIIEKIFLGNQYSQIKRRINSKNYYQMLGEKSKQFNTIKKVRSSFLWKEKLFLIDDYKLQNGMKFSVLLIFEDKSDQDYIIDLPSFLKIAIVREITNEELYLSESIAKKNWKMSQEDYQLITTKFSL